MQSWFRNGLQPLFDVPPIFASHDPDQARLGTAGALKEHDLVWRAGKVDCALHRAQLGALSFFILRYGAAVTIAPGELQHFMLFQVPLSGAAHIRVGNQSVAASRNTGVIISPTLPLQLDWGQGCEQLLLKIPRRRIEQACSELLGADLDEPVEFLPELSLGTPHGRAWQHQIGTLLCYLGGPPQAAPSPWLQAQEEALIHHLLLCQKSNYSQRLMQRPAGAQKKVRVAAEYIHEHLQEPLTLAVIAQASGSSVRGLSMAFQEHYRQSPMAYVRRERMRAARNELLQAQPGARVTDIAYRWGFGHLGRFCAEYSKRYGETPMQSLKR